MNGFATRLGIWVCVCARAFRYLKRVKLHIPFMPSICSIFAQKLSYYIAYLHTKEGESRPIWSRNFSSLSVISLIRIYQTNIKKQSNLRGMLIVKLWIWFFACKRICVNVCELIRNKQFVGKAIALVSWIPNRIFYLYTGRYTDVTGAAHSFGASF